MHRLEFIYRRRGMRQRPWMGSVDPSKVPDPRAVLEAAFGEELAMFEAIGGVPREPKPRRKRKPKAARPRYRPSRLSRLDRLRLWTSLTLSRKTGGSCCDGGDPVAGERYRYGEIQFRLVLLAPPARRYRLAPEQSQEPRSPVFGVVTRIPKRQRSRLHARTTVKLDTVMGVAREMGRLIRLYYNGHISVSELTGYVYALDKTRACLEAAIAIEANAIANASPSIPTKIDVSIITVPSGHFVSNEQLQQMENGKFLKQIEHESIPVDNYAEQAEQQAAADRELNAGIATVANDHGIVPRSPEEAKLMAELNALPYEELLRRAQQAGVLDVVSE